MRGDIGSAMHCKRLHLRCAEIRWTDKSEDHIAAHNVTPDEVESLRGGAREVDDAVLTRGAVRAAVRDAHHRRFSVVEVDNPDHGAERESAMRRGELIHIVDFTVRRAPAMERRAVPRSLAFFGGHGRPRIRRGR